MRKKIFKKYESENDEAFDRYLHAIGVNIIELNEQMEEVD